MKTHSNKYAESKQGSLLFHIWIYFLCVLINILIVTFLIVSKLLILILMPFVGLSFLLRYLNLKLTHFILRENLKAKLDLGSPEIE